jgi:diphosphomevalonate decarboxylase
LRANDIVNSIIKDKTLYLEQVTEFAPINIALIKYWGKRDSILNLPHTSSLSITLPTLGTSTTIAVHDANIHIIIVNNHEISHDSQFYRRLVTFLDLFNLDEKFIIKTKSNVPIAAGLASSASGFCACVKALCKLYNWQLSLTKQSILARLGSGSACRSFWNGFVEWNRGEREDGMDCFAQKFDGIMHDIAVGILVTDRTEKKLSSRKAMQISIDTSPFYSAWLDIVPKHLNIIKQAICENDFESFGKIIEHNTTIMHSLILSSFPSFTFANTDTLQIIQKIHDLRNDGMQVFFTQDAGPNLKLIYLKNDHEKLQRIFPALLHQALLF